jgi:hypothetical protein
LNHIIFKAMTNDELLALYLDNTLTSEQRQVFETRIQTSTELSQEVRELSAIQNMLVLPTLDDEATAVFLRNMENHIAATMLGAGAAVATSLSISAIGAKSGLAAVSATAASITGGSVPATTGIAAMWSSVVASLTTSVVGASIGAATILGGGAATYYAITTLNPKTAENQIPSVVQSPPQQSSTTQTSSNTSASSNVHSETNTAKTSMQVAAPSGAPITEQQSSQTASSAGSATSSSSNVPSSKAHEREYSARISGGTASQGRYAASIQDYTRQLRDKEVAGDRIGSALVEKSLGALLRQAGQFAESRQHLRHSLASAQELNMKELEGEATGELGLLLVAEGKKSQAESLLREAVATLSAVQSRSLERWQRELDKIAGTK